MIFANYTIKFFKNPGLWLLLNILVVRNFFSCINSFIFFIHTLLHIHDKYMQIMYKLSKIKNRFFLNSIVNETLTNQHTVD